MTSLRNTDQKKRSFFKEKVGSLVRRGALLYLVAVLFAVWGYAAGQFQVFPFRYLNQYYSEISAFLDRRTGSPNPEITNSKFNYQGFIRRDAEFVDPGYLLLSRFSKDDGQDVIELVRLRDFKVLHRWVPPIEKLSKNLERKNYAQLQHPLLLKNGEIVFHFRWRGGSLVKIDRNNQIVWTLDGIFHHSIELSHDGNLIVIGDNVPSLFELPFAMKDQGYAVITQEGQALRRFSAAQILMNNGYRGLFLGTGLIDNNRLHLNDAEPIDRDIGMARTGDVALSIRSLSTVLLFRPSTGKIVWLKTGPWLMQHDVNLLDDGRYSVFGNDVYDLGNRDFRSADGISNIYLYNPRTDQVEAPFTSILKEAAIFSNKEGRCRILPNGDAFIEETQTSRILRISKDKVRWEYVNGATKTTVGALCWSRYITEGEFKSVAGDLWG